MKRSDFIDKMIKEFDSMNREPESKRELAGMLLDVVEKLGMLPPIPWGRRPGKVKEICKWEESNED